MSESLLVRAARLEPVERPPVWIMRQAGRYLPEYAALRERVSFAELLERPEVAAEASLLPLGVLGVDAVIVFSDILAPLAAMGIRVEFTDKGPVILDPVGSPPAAGRLRVPAMGETAGAVSETIRILVRELGGRAPVIGFAGAPLTLSAYAVEGKLTRDLRRLKAFLYSEPVEAHELLGKLTDVVIGHGTAQVEAGAALIQLFDTWSGALPVELFRSFALPYLQRAVISLRRTGVPVAVYSKGTSGYLAELVAMGAGVISVDWTVDLAEVRNRWGEQVAFQGNLDPAALLASPEQVRELALRMVAEAGPATGYIANLGHGILPETPVACARAFVDAVRDSGGA